ncbi:substrate-binding domain-containing protein [Oceanobacillus sojae]|uniref:substrate-binding domain-containing protein n=1 Tax=Oceanobacillus sojae TaxID=582851 RepID=UPI001588CE50|nr:substrate-binding domain-containing protein [Oceanobacillus sojae]
MKRLSLFVLFILTVLFLGACGNEDGGSDNENDGDFKVGFSQATLNHPFRVAMVEDFEEYLNENHPDVEFLLTDGEDNASTQVSDIETLVSQGVDILVVSPHSSDALTPIIAEVMEKGIPVITVDRTVNTEVTAHVGADNKEIGQTFGEYIADQVDGEGNIIEIQGTAGSSATIERSEGFREAIEGTDIELIAEQHADYLREPAMSFMEDMLQRFSDTDSIQAIYAHNDEMGLGALDAIKASGREGEIKVFSIDGQNNAFESVDNGGLAAVAIYPHGGTEAAEIAMKVLEGEDVDEEYILEFNIVDETNVEEFLGTGI